MTNYTDGTNTRRKQTCKMKKRKSHDEQNTSTILIKSKRQTQIKWKRKIYYLLLREYTSWFVVRILMGLHNTWVTYNLTDGKTNVSPSNKVAVSEWTNKWACRESHILKMSESRPVVTVKTLSPFLWRRSSRCKNRWVSVTYYNAAQPDGSKPIDEINNCFAKKNTAENCAE